MLSDRELEHSLAQLEDFRVSSEKHNKTHGEILERYSSLMQDYKRLLSDFEEARESREKYKQLARGSERNPFVLVLVDGDGYLFDDDLVRDGREDGGSRAANMLNDYVKASLRNLGLDHCKVMVRIYMNLAGLSKAMSQAKVPSVGPEKRSLAPFVANFNRSNELFDIVDAGEMKENADFKIRAMFRQFVENSQCKHIYFAACHDVGYITELTPYRTNRERITLVRASAFHPEFSKLGFRQEDFPRVFRTTGLTFSGTSTAEKVHESKTSTAPINNHTSTPSIEGTPCSFFPKGLCKYGKSCKFLHVSQDTSGSNNNGSNAASWRTTSSPSKSSAQFQMADLTKSDNDFMSGHQNLPARSQLDFMNLLPKEDSVPPTEIPINKDQERLDYYIPTPSPESRALFKSRTARAKLCNQLHINGACDDSTCQYDHSAITEGTRDCLRQMSLSRPCPRRGGCRLKNCTYGHICQKAECIHRGGKVFCKFPIALHMVDLNPTEYLTIEEASAGEIYHVGLSPSQSISEAEDEGPGVLLDDSDASLD